MKKISRKLVALLTSLFLVLAMGGYFTSCSSDSDDGSPAQVDNSGDPTPNPDPNPSTVTPNPTNTDEKVAEEGDGAGYIFTTNTLGYESTQADTSITEIKEYLDGKVTVIAGGTMAVDVKGFKTNNMFEEAKTDVYGYIRLNGRDVPTAENWLTSATRVIAFKVPKTASKVYIFAKAAGSGTAKLSVTADKSNYILNESIDNTAYVTKEIDVTALELTEDTIFYLYNKNEVAGTSNTGVNLKGIMVVGTEKAAQDAPTAEEFTVTDPTSAGAKGSITYAGQNVAGLQYKDGDSWYKWGVEAGVAKEFAAGKVTVRYGYTDTLKSSDNLELTINEFVNKQLEAATAPAEGSVTATATTTADNNDGTLTVNAETESRALEYKLGDGNWTSFNEENKATGLASGTYTIRVKASETYNASTETINVIVKKFTAAPAAADFAVTVASSDSAKDGKITAKSAEAVANLMVVGVGENGADVAWSALAETEAPLVLTVKAGTYKAYYAETETTTKSAESEILVGVKVLFSSFVADGLKSENSSSYEALASADGLVVTTARAKYQTNNWSTPDYNAEAGTGYTYTARVKLNVKSGSVEGKMTISNVAVGSVLRIDGGNSSDDVRTLSFSGTDSDSIKWNASTCGSFYVTATAETVVLTSETNEFCIYGIHVVNEKVAATQVSAETTYYKPTVELSAKSVVKGTEVTITTTIPQSVTKKTMSDGTVTKENADVNAEIIYEGATVTDSKVDTSNEGTLTIKASYKIGEGETAETYTSEAVTLEVTGAFASKTETITNDDNTLGLTAASVESSDTAVATVEKTDSGIEITSVAAGNATITFSDGTNSGTIEVEVGAGGDITTKINAYRAVSVYSLTPNMISSWTSAKNELTSITTEGAKFQAGTGVTYDSSAIKLAGSCQKAGKNCIVLTTTSDNAKITVKFHASNADRYIVAIAGTTTNAVNKGAAVSGSIYDDSVKTDSKNTVQTVTLTLPTKGTYSVGALNSLYIDSLEVEM